MKRYWIIVPALALAAGCASQNETTSGRSFEQSSAYAATTPSEDSPSAAVRSQPAVRENQQLANQTQNQPSTAQTQPTSAENQPSTQTAKQDANQLIADWKDAPKKAATTALQQYGQPDEQTPQRLLWKSKGPFKFIEVVNQEITHNFPMPHQDCLKQTIDLKVPVEKCSDLAQFDGSLLVDRTKGELSARCDNEAMNFLALNVANDIITGKRNVADARDFFAKTAAAFAQGQKDPYTQSLQALTPTGSTADPDVTLQPGQNKEAQPNQGDQPKEGQSPAPKPDQSQTPSEPSSQPQQPVPSPAPPQ